MYQSNLSGRNHVKTQKIKTNDSINKEFFKIQKGKGVEMEKNTPSLNH